MSSDRKRTLHTTDSVVDLFIALCTASDECNRNPLGMKQVTEIP
jgi:hypothetical protein